MRFGISTQSRGLWTTRAAYKAVAQAAEKAGFDFLAVNDHLVVPAKLDSPYPCPTPTRRAARGRQPATGIASTSSRRWRFSRVSRSACGSSRR